MFGKVFAVAFLSCASAQVLHKLELDDKKTPYDYVKERLKTLGTDLRTGLPLSSSYEVEESGDYPESLQGAATNVITNAVGANGIGLGQGYIGGLGGLGGGGIGQGLGFGLNGGGLGIGLGGFNGLGVINGGGGINGGGAINGGGVINGAVNGIGLGGVGNGIGLINPAIGGIGYNGIGGLGLGGGGLLYHQPVFGGQVGSGYVDKKAYDSAQKKGADENIEKLEKKAGEEAKHGQEGYQQAAALNTAAKGDAGFYKDEESKKKAAGDEKFYEGGQKFDKQGANEEEVKKAKSHKKGHVSKGFKSSSSKNEEEKSESFYDEAHDEANHKLAGQNAGSFGENSHQGFKGAHEEKVLDANSQGKEGHHVSQQKIDDSKANKGEFLQKGYKGDSEVLEKFNNLGAQSVHGHQEASGGFQQSKGILPIHV